MKKNMDLNEVYVIIAEQKDKKFEVLTPNGKVLEKAEADKFVEKLSKEFI